MNKLIIVGVIGLVAVLSLLLLGLKLRNKSIKGQMASITNTKLYSPENDASVGGEVHYATDNDATTEISIRANLPADILGPQRYGAYLHNKATGTKTFLAILERYRAGDYRAVALFPSVPGATSHVIIVSSGGDEIEKIILQD